MQLPQPIQNQVPLQHQNSAPIQNAINDLPAPAQDLLGAFDLNSVPLSIFVHQEINSLLPASALSAVGAPEAIIPGLKTDVDPTSTIVSKPAYFELDTHKADVDNFVAIEAFSEDQMEELEPLLQLVDPSVLVPQFQKDLITSLQLMKRLK